MKLYGIAAVCALSVLVSAGTVHAQTWTGLYLGGFVGGGSSKDNASEFVMFDTNLDGAFTDTVRTAAGVDAFSPGFCGGLAVNATPGGGCTDDEKGADFGGRVGYDWQLGHFVIGGVFDIARTDVIDGVSAFSTTPAFYSFARELKYVAGFRGRAGFATNRLLVYGTGGRAIGNVDERFTTSNVVNTFVPVNRDAGDVNVSGYQAGAGVEVRLGGHLSVTGEYLFTSLDDREDSTIRSQGPAPATNPFILVNPAGTDLQRSDRFELQAVRVGLNFRF